MKRTDAGRAATKPRSVKVIQFQNSDRSYQSLWMDKTGLHIRSEGKRRPVTLRKSFAWFAGIQKQDTWESADYGACWNDWLGKIGGMMEKPHKRTRQLPKPNCDPVTWSADRHVSVVTLPDGTGSFVRFHGKALREVIADCKRRKITTQALLLELVARN